VRTIGFGRLNNMRSLVKATLLAATVLATGTVINAQVSIGIVIAPPPPARMVVVVPERPAPEFVWVDGMKAIGLDRPTRGLAGLDRTTTANGTI
jgi:hypothetical protein